ncbi:MAG: hypothetical protein M1831_001218 [Alyxoria varia]|nr:MAG: hypothetical protein M1831_001218 [Alyxoria varia]
MSTKLVTATEALAESHHLLAQRVETDVEKPLREYTNQNRDIQQMSNMQGNLASLSKDVEDSQAKAEKGKEGRARFTRKHSGTGDAEAAQAHWDSQAPYVFEQLQALDETRFNHLKDVLTQFQTHEADRVEKSRVTVESCINALLSVDTRDEIQTFAVRYAGAGAGANVPTSYPPRASSRHGRRESRFQPSASSLAPPPTLNPDGADDRTSAKSQSIHDEKKSRFRGLKRLSTVMTRRRNSVVPPVPKASPFRSKQGTKLGSSVDLPNEPMPQSIPPDEEQPLPPPPKIGQMGRKDLPERPSSSHRGYSESTANGGTPTAGPSGVTNGISRTSSRAQQVSQLPEQRASTPSQAARELEGNRAPLASSDPISQAQAEAADFNESSSSGLKVDIKNTPVNEEGTDALAARASVANTLKALLSQATPRRTGTNRGRRDVRNTVFVPSPQPGETPFFEQQAPQFPQPNVSTPPLPMQSTPQSASTAGAIGGLPSTRSFGSSQGHRPFGSGEDHNSSDAVSIRSGRSLGSTTSTHGTMVKHPELALPGLNSSLIETVNVTFDHGSIAKCSVLGELALAFNEDRTNFTSIPTNESIRLENFPVLEKVAPNPSFISQPSQDRPGEYSIDVAAIAPQASKPQIAFKYQVHLDEIGGSANSGVTSGSRHVPILLSTNWKVEQTQTLVMLNCTVNPSFPASTITLTNATIILFLGEGAPGKATGCQSKPAGTFSKDRGLIYWRINELKLGAAAGGETQKKFLAKFTTDAESRPGRVEARWEMKGVGAEDGGAPVVFGSGLGVSRLERSTRSDPFSDGEGAGGSASWRDVPSRRKLISGAYVAT